MRNAQTFSNSQKMLTASKVHSCLDTLPNQNDLSCRKGNVQFWVTSYTSKLLTFLDLLYCPAGWKKKTVNVLITYNLERTWTGILSHWSSPQPAALRQVRWVFPIWTQSCNKLKQMVAGSKTHSPKKSTTFLKCHPTTRAPQKCSHRNLNRNLPLAFPPRLFSEPSWPKSGLRYVIMVPSTRHKKLQRRTLNHHHSLWKCVCAYSFFVADVTDLFW